jgi:DtxR family Mn-dependent transcriptional regulator
MEANMRVKTATKQTPAVEDYLKAVYHLTAGEGRVSTGQLAEQLHVTPASATGMAQNLARMKPPLLEYEKRHGVSLTEAGRRIALEILRHHRLIELYLHQSLGYGWDEVHDEAERLEHVISEQLEERIAAFLGNPSNDPHGDPIPDRFLKLPPSTGIALDQLLPGKRAILQRVAADRDPDLLRYLEGLGLVPGAHVLLLERSPYDGNLCLQVDHRPPVILGEMVTARLYVVPVPEPSSSQEMATRLAG